MILGMGITNQPNGARTMFANLTDTELNVLTYKLSHAASRAWTRRGTKYAPLGMVDELTEIKRDAEAERVIRYEGF